MKCCGGVEEAGRKELASWSLNHRLAGGEGSGLLSAATPAKAKVEAAMRLGGRSCVLVLNRWVELGGSRRDLGGFT